MIGIAPEVRWKGMLEKVDKGLEDDVAYNIRLKPSAPDEEKTAFEEYMMNEENGWHFLKEALPDMDKPYYTWEGKVVEYGSLKGRALPPVEENPWPDDMV